MMKKFKKRIYEKNEDKLTDFVNDLEELKKYIKTHKI